MQRKDGISETQGRKKFLLFELRHVRQHISQEVVICLCDMLPFYIFWNWFIEFQANKKCFLLLKQIPPSPLFFLKGSVY